MVNAQATALFNLSELSLIDAEPEACFDAYTTLASRVLQCKVALISFVDPGNDRQFFKSALGLQGEWAIKRQTPLSHSFCKLVVERDAPLVVEDAVNHPLVADNLAIRDLNVRSYLGAPVRDNCGHPVGALCVINDVPSVWSDEQVATIRELADCASSLITLRAATLTSERLRRDQALFASALSHDLKSPMRSIQMCLSELEHTETEFDEEALELLEMARTKAKQGQELLDNTLDYAAAGSAVRRSQAVDCEALARAVAAELEADLLEGGVDLEIEPLSAAQGDERQILLAFRNIIGNAVKYRKPDRPHKVAVSMSEPKREGFVTYRISDNGIGVEQRFLPNLFEPFKRFTSDPRYRGSGLGLAISKTVADNHGGRIDVTSVMNEGTTFFLTLPKQVV